MKNTMRCLGFIALVVVIGFTLVACDDGSGPGGGGGGNNPPVAGSVHVSMSAGPEPDEFTLTLSRGQWFAGTGTFHYIGGSQIDTLAFFINPDTYTDNMGQTARPTFNYRRMGDTDKNKLVINMEARNLASALSVDVRFGSDESMVYFYLTQFMDPNSMNPAPSTITYDKNAQALTITAQP